MDYGLKPFFDSDSRVLILGSFPSRKSFAQDFYYGNPNNRFFVVLETLFEDSCGTTVEEKKAFLKRHKIALFDVIKACSLKGSSDASIKDVEVNDIQAIIDQSDIQVVCTLGNTASKLYEQFVTCNKKHIALPSSSSANARMRIEDLVKAYAVILRYIDGETN